MLTTDLEKHLYDALASFEIIDSHEHLSPEYVRTDAKVDVFTLFSHYTRGDLITSGMTEEQHASLFNHDLPLDLRWRSFKPFWDRIRWGSYARAALIAAKRFYGYEDINDDTYVGLSEAIRKFNTPGIYHRVLREACNIRVALAQCSRTDLDSPLLIPVMPLAINGLRTWAQLTEKPHGLDKMPPIRCLDDYIDALCESMTNLKAQGAVGFKLGANPNQIPDRTAAIEAFESVRNGSVARLPQSNAMWDYIVDRAIAHTTALDLVVCVHTGYWGDFRTLDPLHMIPIVERHKKTRFDIYHLGYPWMRESIMLGKGHANVWLNLCWTHIISQRFVTVALDELIDTIPMNKIIGFGADYAFPVEKVYGHLVMAREDFARVLARRIECGQMNETQALGLAKLWLWDNPRDLYKLNV